MLDDWKLLVLVMMPFFDLAFMIIHIASIDGRCIWAYLSCKRSLFDLVLDFVVICCKLGLEPYFMSMIDRDTLDYILS